MAQQVIESPWIGGKTVVVQSEDNLHSSPAQRQTCSDMAVVARPPQSHPVVHLWLSIYTDHMLLPARVWNVKKIMLVRNN